MESFTSKAMRLAALRIGSFGTRIIFRNPCLAIAIHRRKCFFWYKNAKK